MLCLLCESKETYFFFKNSIREYYRCPHCDLIFVPPSQHLTPKEEKKRYEEHNNDPKDVNYCLFLEKLLTPLRGHIKGLKYGLDYGCGPGPAISFILEKEGYLVENYDPLFRPIEFTGPYDFITCTEVIEHFCNPKKEWSKLIAIGPGSYLGVMTHFYSDVIDFSKWYYKNDPGHVVFYTHKTMYYIAGCFSLNLVEMGDRYAIFKIPPPLV